jgi:hypothetical protein
LRPTKLFQVYLYRAHSDYLHRVGPLFVNTAGMFVSFTGAGAMAPPPNMKDPNFLTAFYEGQGREEMRRTLQHEAFHQFVHEALPNGLPIWLNEGMAQVYQEGLWTGQGFWMGQVPPRRLRLLQFDLKNNRLVDFKALGLLSHQQWAQVFTGPKERGATQYNQAWAMAYFLMHFKDAAGQQPYRARLVSLLQLMNAGTDATTAFNQVFPDAAGVHAQFLVFAAGLQPTVEAALIDRQSTLAELIKGLHRQQPIPNDIAKVRRMLIADDYHVLYSMGDLHWESQADVTVYLSDLAGRPFTQKELFLESRPGLTVPDIICRCLGPWPLRTHFNETAAGLEHETLLEPAPVTAVTATARKGERR